MNNEQFRKLVASAPTQQNASSTPRPAGAAALSLGAKKSSFVPMTPRNIHTSSGVDFARQVRERNAALKPVKKFKSSAPRGTKFGAEYVDRAKARAEGDGTDEKAERIKALEEQMKLDQISPEVYYALRDEITGGRVEDTHLVKGLDRRLLERVRAGEDVLGLRKGETSLEDEAGEDVEDELEKAAEKIVEPVVREKVEKKGVTANPMVGQKRTRDDLLAELKAQRKAAAEAQEAAAPKLNDRWAKVDGKKKSRIEIDQKGREVLVTVDEKGMVKRRVRKAPTQDDQATTGLHTPDDSKPVLGADAVLPLVKVEESQVAEPSDDDEDIFEGVGTDYNPLPEPEDGDSDDSDTAEALLSVASASDKSSAPVADDSSADEEGVLLSPAPPTTVTKAAPTRNYFGDQPAATVEDAQDRLAGIQAVIQKAARLDPLTSSADPANAEEEARRKKRAQMLANEDRDLEDMDLGFGSNRVDDEADGDGDGKKIKLSEWKDDGGNEEDGDGRKGGKSKGGEKKRKPKKRKGDANSMGDIMRVLEGRKEGKK